LFGEMARRVSLADPEQIVCGDRKHHGANLRRAS